MIVLLIVLILIALVITSMLLLGFRLGRESNAHAFFEVRREALLAQRHIQEITRDAFQEMVDHVQRLRGERPIDKQ